MANKYDKIIKELLGQMQSYLMEKLFGFIVRSVRPLPPKMQQTTIEKEADMLAEIELVDGTVMILHIEWQTSNDPEMVSRMLFYRMLIDSKYGKPVFGVVIYLGQAVINMNNTIEEPGLSYHVRMLDVRDLVPEIFWSLRILHTGSSRFLQVMIRTRHR